MPDHNISRSAPAATPIDGAVGFPTHFPTSAVEAAAQQPIIRRRLIAAGLPVLAIGRGRDQKGPMARAWQTMPIDEASFAPWDRDLNVPSTGVRLGSVEADGSLSCRRGSIIGFDIDADSYEIGVAVAQAFEAACRAAGIVGPFVRSIRLDGRATGRVKYLFEAGEDFDEESMRAVNVRFDTGGRGEFGVEMYARGRQFIVTGWNFKGNCPVALQIGDRAPGVDMGRCPVMMGETWKAVGVWLTGGCGTGFPRKVSTVDPRRNLHGSAEDLAASVEVDPETGKITDGRHAVVYHALASAYGKCMDDPRVPAAILEDAAARRALVVSTAWAWIERDVDVDLPQSSGGWSGSGYWDRGFVDSRFSNVDQRRFDVDMAQRRADDAADPVRALQARPVTNAGEAAALAAELAASCPEMGAVSEVRARKEAEARADANATSAAEFERVQAARAAEVAQGASFFDDPALELSRLDKPHRRARGSEALISGLNATGEISVLVAGPGVGKTTLMASFGALVASGAIARKDTIVFDPRGRLGNSGTYVNPNAIHVLISFEGAQVVDPVIEGVAEDVGGFQEFPAPSWWGFTKNASAAVRVFGNDPNYPGFVTLDMSALAASDPVRFGAGQLVRRAQFGGFTANSAILETLATLFDRLETIPGSAVKRPIVATLDNIFSSVEQMEDTDSISALRAALQGLARGRRLGWTVIHHTTKDKKDFAGSESIHRMADTVNFLARDTVGSRIIMFGIKSRARDTIKTHVGFAQYKTLSNKYFIIPNGDEALNEDRVAFINRVYKAGAYNCEFNIDPIDIDARDQACIVRAFPDIAAVRAAFPDVDPKAPIPAVTTSADLPMISGPQLFTDAAVFDQFVELARADAAKMTPDRGHRLRDFGGRVGFGDLGAGLHGLIAEVHGWSLTSKESPEFQAIKLFIEGQTDAAQRGYPGSPPPLRFMRRAVDGEVRNKAGAPASALLIDEGLVASTRETIVNRALAKENPYPVPSSVPAAPVAPAPATPNFNPFAPIAPPVPVVPWFDAPIAPPVPALVAPSIAGNPFAPAPDAPIASNPFAPAPIIVPQPVPNPFAPPPTPTRAAPTPEQRAEREARQLAKSAMEARVHREAVEAAMLIPASRAAAGIRWEIREKPARPTMPRAPAPKEKPPVDTSPLERRVAAGARTMDEVFLIDLPAAEGEIESRAAAMFEASARAAMTAAPPVQLGNVPTSPPRRPLNPFAPGWGPAPAHPRLPPHVVGVWQ